eukprot:5547517-Amphidinium_carterae.2
MANKQRSGPLPPEHLNGTRTVSYYKNTKGKEEIVGHTRDEQLTLVQPPGDAPEQQATAIRPREALSTKHCHGIPLGARVLSQTHTR